MTEQVVTPLPKLKVATCCIIMFVNSFMASNLLPFLSFMISDFGIAPNPDDVPYYAGYMVASFMLGQFCFSYFWGKLSDVFGRRPVLMIGLVLTGLSYVAFGFSTTYQMAIVLRTLTGSVNGIVGVCKTYMSEITDSTNQSKGFGYFGVSRGMGMIMGPIVGGFLCMPAKKYPSIFPPSSIFAIYPYALPCVIGSFVAFSGCLLGYFVLEETNRSILTSELNESTPLLQESNTSQESVAPVRKPATLMQLFRQPKVAYSLGFYFAVTFVFIQFDELFALWSRLPFEEGGIEFDSSDQGTAYAIGGIALFVYQIFLFAKVERYFGTLNAFRSGILMSIPAFIILPLIGEFEFHNGSFEWLMWILVGSVQILRNVGGMQAFTSTFILISNSVTSESRGGINGIGQSLASLSRMIGPIFGGTLFSWSLENGLAFPFNYYFIFLLLGLFLLVLLLVSMGVPDDINERIPEAQENQ